MKTTEERREYQRLYRIKHKERLKEEASTASARRKAREYQVAYALNPVRIEYRQSVRDEQNERNKLRMRNRRLQKKAEGVEA